MTTQEVKRKLTAILSADVKGYSCFMGEDGAGRIRTLNAYKEMITNLMQRHHARVVDAPGDNLLAEFASVVDAVECAVEIQKELKARNAEFNLKIGTYTIFKEHGIPETENEMPEMSG